MSPLDPAYIRDGLSLAARFKIGGVPITDLSRDELMAIVAQQARTLNDIRQAQPFITRVAMAANEERA